jgi:hypothetical protein
MGFTAPASRNAACPCGSGRRYKDCHGALAPPAEASRRDAVRRRSPGVQPLLDEALAFQQAGDFPAAAERYARVIAQEPGNVDALHMLGVTRFQQYDLDAAVPLLEQAAAIAPGLAAVRVNLELLRAAQRLRAAEIDLARAVLPRVRGWCDDAGRLHDAHLPGDVLVADRRPDAALLARVVHGWPRGARVHPSPPFVAATSVVNAPVDVGWSPSSPTVVVLLGLDEPVALWGEVPPAHPRVLVVTRDAPDLVHDRLGELSLHGRVKVHVRYADEATARGIGLPGALLAGAHAS